MEWYNYLAAFFAGAFMANTVPHLIHGISGNQFPTPFSKPRGVGLSSSTLNVAWSLINLFLGFSLVKAAHMDDHNLLWLTSFAGFATMSLLLSVRFKAKHKPE